MTFDLTDLRLFVHVVDRGSITRGAEQANLALASASSRIRGMEEALGVPLLERGRRGVRPTAAGQALLQHARVIGQQLTALRGDLDGFARGLRGQVRVLCNTAAISEFLPRPLASWLATHPSIDLELEECPSAAIVQAVMAGRADLGVAADTVDLGALECYPFATDHLVLVVPRRHRLAARRRIAFADVLDEPFVGLTADSALQRHIAEHAARSGLRLAVRVRLPSFEAICQMVAAGVGVAVVPAAAAARCRRAMAIGTVTLADAWTRRRLTIGVRRLTGLSAPARDLLAHLRAHGERAGQNG